MLKENLRAPELPQSPSPAEGLPGKGQQGEPGLGSGPHLARQVTSPL